MITGKTLIDLGFKPGAWFKKALLYVNTHDLQGEELLTYLHSIAPKIIEPYEYPIAYYQNIEAITAEEQENLAQVHKAMQELLRTPTLVKAAIMPDACPVGGKGQIPVGGIAVAKNAIHPAMHSADICCSLMMTNLGRIDPKSVLDMAEATTHFGGGGRERFSTLPQALLQAVQDNPYLNDTRSQELAHSHLGTQGDGNHFLFVGQSKNTGETILVTHHGSRGFGAKLYKKGMKIAESFRKRLSPNTLKKNAWIPFDTQEGQNYWEALQIVRTWTKFNHSTLHDAIVEGLGIQATHRQWNEHNFVFKRGDLFYHGKGATPLSGDFLPDAENDLRIIPLNMSQPILIVRGEEQEHNLGFAPHGAGRNTSRSAHKRKFKERSDEDIFAQETAGLDVRFYSKRIDISELPSAYKNAEEVKAQIQQFKLGEVVDEILPYGCIMAGDWDWDKPWRRKKKK